MFKRLTKSAAAGRAASFAINAYIRLVEATSSWRYVHPERFTAAEEDGKGVILAFWHGRMVMMPALRKKTSGSVHMLISTHRDGDIIANGVKSFGVNFIRGSAANPKKPEKEKSGAPALMQMIAALEAGDVVGVTPDGPRGPRARSKIGVVRLAAMTGAPILPIAFSTSRAKELKSWDNFLLAAPFSHGYYVVGKPLRVAGDADREALSNARDALDDALTDVTQQADALAGRNTAPTAP